MLVFKMSGFTVVGLQTGVNRSSADFADFSPKLDALWLMKDGLHINEHIWIVPV